MAHYTHRQTSIKALVLAPIAAGIGVAILLVANNPTPSPRGAIAILLAVVVGVTAIGAIFSTMTTKVTDSEVVVGFRFGAMRRRIPFGDIVRAERATIPWWQGTGVKYGWKNTSYLVRPGPAVALVLKSGRTLRIGTDDPDGLLSALQR